MAIVTAALTAASTVKTALPILSGLFGGETSDLPRDIRYKYFDGHHDRVRDRHTNGDFFRFAWYAGYWTGPGASEIPAGMTVADYYVTKWPQALHSISDPSFRAAILKNNPASCLVLTRSSQGDSRLQATGAQAAGQALPSPVLAGFGGDWKTMLLVGVGLLVVLKVGKVI